jgi:hypothetical protein
MIQTFIKNGILPARKKGAFPVCPNLSYGFDGMIFLDHSETVQFAGFEQVIRRTISKNHTAYAVIK